MASHSFEFLMINFSDPKKRLHACACGMYRIAIDTCHIYHWPFQQIKKTTKLYLLPFKCHNKKRTKSCKMPFWLLFLFLQHIKHTNFPIKIKIAFHFVCIYCFTLPPSTGGNWFSILAKLDACEVSITRKKRKHLKAMRSVCVFVCVIHAKSVSNDKNFEICLDPWIGAWMGKALFELNEEHSKS